MEEGGPGLPDRKTIRELYFSMSFIRLAGLNDVKRALLKYKTNTAAGLDHLQDDLQDRKSISRVLGGPCPTSRSPAPWGLRALPGMFPGEQGCDELQLSPCRQSPAQSPGALTGALVNRE